MGWEDGSAEGEFYDEPQGYARVDKGDLSVGGLIADAWEVIKGNTLEAIGGMVAVFGVIAGVQMAMTMAIYVVIFAGALIGAVLAEVVGEEVVVVLAIAGGSFVYILLLALMVAIQALGMGAYQMFWLKTVRGQEEPVQYVAAVKALSLPLILGMLLQTCAVMVGSLALVIGAYVAMIGLMMMPFLIIDHGLKPLASMKASWALMSGHKVQLLVLILALSVINFGGMLACGAGMLVTLPLTFGSIALFYDRIARPGNTYLRF